MPTPGTELGGCISPFPGCTDSAYSSYAAYYNVHVQSKCFLGGCTDSTAVNYNSQATYDTSTCRPPPAGCTDKTASNYWSTALVDDGTCVIFGCTASDGFNYNPKA